MNVIQIFWDSLVNVRNCTLDLTSSCSILSGDKKSSSESKWLKMVK